MHGLARALRDPAPTAEGRRFVAQFPDSSAALLLAEADSGKLRKHTMSYRGKLEELYRPKASLRGTCSRHWRLGCVC